MGAVTTHNTRAKPDNEGCIYEVTHECIIHTSLFGVYYIL